MKLTDSAQKQLLDEIQTTLGEVQKTLLTHDSVLSEFIEYAHKRDSHSPILTRLKDQLRIELLADLLKQQETAHEEVASLQCGFSALHAKHEALEADHAQQFAALHTQLLNHRGHFQSVRQEHDLFISQLNLIDRAISAKASADDLGSVKATIKQLASAQSVQQVWESLDTVAQASDVLALQEAVDALTTALAQTPSADTVQAAVQRVDSRGKARLKKYTRFEDVAAAVAARESDLEEKLTKLHKKVYQDTDMLGKRMTDLKKFIDKEPWQAAVASVLQKVGTKAEKIDLELLVERTLPKLDEANSHLDKFKRRIDEFDAVLARFDEIILNKASKEDLEIFRLQLAQRVELPIYEQHLAQGEAATHSLQQRSAELAAAVERISAQLHSYGVSYEAQAKKTREVAWAVANVQELQQLLGTKADVSEIHTLRTTLGSQEELEQLKQGHSGLDREFKQALLILAETLRTTLQLNESPRRKQQTRETLFNTAASLLQKSPPQRVTLRDTRPCSVKAGKPALLRSRLRVKASLHDQFGDTFKTIQ